ncbi:dynamin family protein [Pseudoponticoccus marisrubri]|uniref:Dynamin N-terminal domain-containing protein n=1 Tax=Pseudoponticoccus marisrubri TaxID=1685382 RepID=A0A0W7WKF2_9RHOB|nr:dynamin family protein [Pseudoponticoccus marisrubri]KUF11091.1 hypothetical protein AVJ23_08515 [Pseudoponticoccus marisrubri]
MTTHDTAAQSAPTRRPRIALMGEFSAGKSTLANLLLGQDVSPVKVTATQLPPVWYAHGPRALHRVDNSGTEEPIPPEALDGISHRETQAVRIRLETEVLEFCDLIDMPGTADPNMPQAVWDRMLGRVDGVVWCTPATQAWRQSEAALWEQVPHRLYARSLLLITRMDKLHAPGDRDRVLARLRRETDGLFTRVLPISLTEAIADPDNPDTLKASGADLFVESLVELVESLGQPPAGEANDGFEPITPAAPLARPEPVATPGVVPRRVVPRRIRARPRPEGVTGRA